MRFLFFITLFLSMCHVDNNSEKALAKVNGSYLYPSDILGLDYNEDEVRNISKNQIEEWVNNEVWYSKASKELDDVSSIERKVEAYKRSLYINAYKEKYLSTKAVNVSDEEIIDYFKKNDNKYRNEENLFKIQTVIVDNKLSNIEEIKQAMHRNAENQFLADYCQNNINKCILTPTWVNESYLSDLNLPSYLWKTKVKVDEYFLEDDMVLLYRITESRNKGELVPLEQVSQEIISILEFQETKKILDKLQNELIMNAQKNNEIEIFK